MNIICPQCGIEHEDSVATCDCGFDLEQHRRVRRKQGKPWIRTMLSQPYPILRIVRELTLVYVVLFGIYAIVQLIMGIIGGDGENIANAVCIVPLIVFFLLGLVELINLVFKIHDQQINIIQMLSQIKKRED